MDYAGPYEGHHFLICVDAKSKWMEVRPIRNAPTSSVTISLLNGIFAFHGFPNCLVSDNATIFTSEEFKAYCSARGIFQKLIAPGHPATNGLAERNVQTFKHRLASIANESGTMMDKVQRIVFRYRATPLSSGKTPAELYLNRKMRIELDAIFPNKPSKPDVAAPPVRSLFVGERVQSRGYTQNREIWQFGVVTQKLGSRHYMVKLDCGRELKRHINQLMSTRVPKQDAHQEDSRSVSKGHRSVVFNVPQPGPCLRRQDVNEPQPPVPPPLPAPVPLVPASVPNPFPADHQLRRSGRERRPPKRFPDYVTP